MENVTEYSGLRGSVFRSYCNKGVLKLDLVDPKTVKQSDWKLRAAILKNTLKILYSKSGTTRTAFIADPESVLSRLFPEGASIKNVLESRLTACIEQLFGANSGIKIRAKKRFDVSAGSGWGVEADGLDVYIQQPPAFV